MMIYIAGASGFIGKALYSYLRDRGYRVMKLGRRWEDEQYKTKGGILINAAWIGVEGNARDADIQDGNIELTESLITLAKRLEISKVVSIGSQAEYGNYLVPTKEDSPLHPLTKYGLTKVKCHKLWYEETMMSNIDLVWLRLYDPYGPGDSERWFLPYVVRCALEDKSPVITECAQVWDYIYIEDVCRGVERVLHEDVKGQTVYNLGSGERVTLREVVEMVFKEVKPKSARPVFGGRTYREGEPMCVSASMEKLRGIGFECQVDLTNGIRRTVRDMQRTRT